MPEDAGTNPFALCPGMEALLSACAAGRAFARDGRWRDANVRFHGSVADEAVAEGWVTSAASLTRAGEMRLKISSGRLPEGVALAVMTEGRGFKVEAAWPVAGMVERATISRADRREACHLAVRAYNAAFPRVREVTFLQFVGPSVNRD